MRTSRSTDLLLSSSWRRIEKLAGDASARRYSRLWTADGGTVVLVEYPGSEGRRFSTDLQVLGWCRSHGLPVPEVLAHDHATGRAILSDLGVHDAESFLEELPDHRRARLLRALLDPLAILARIETNKLPPWNAPLDRTRLRWELAGFELWFVRHLRGREPGAELGRWLDELSSEIASHPVRVCHRDYHLNNILIGREDSVGVIDIQDILIGPDTYDPVSLLDERSAARLIPTDERRRLLERWARITAAAPGWEERAAAVRLQRGLKVLGTFARFTLAGRSAYRVWLDELAFRLRPRLDAAGAPTVLSALLLD